VRGSEWILDDPSSGERPAAHGLQRDPDRSLEANHRG